VNMVVNGMEVKEGMCVQIHRFKGGMKCCSPKITEEWIHAELCGGGTSVCVCVKGRIQDREHPEVVVRKEAESWQQVRAAGVDIVQEEQCRKHTTESQCHQQNEEAVKAFKKRVVCKSPEWEGIIG